MELDLMASPMQGIVRIFFAGALSAITPAVLASPAAIDAARAQPANF